jgi:hypothetical protein
VALLAEQAPAYGFGFVDRKPMRTGPRSGAKAAGYVAGYVAGKSGSKAGVSIREMACRMPSRRRVWWVSSELSKASGVTMTSLRFGRQMWAAEQGLCSYPEAGLAVVGWQVVDCATGAILRAVWTLEDVLAVAEG